MISKNQYLAEYLKIYVDMINVSWKSKSFFLDNLKGKKSHVAFKCILSEVFQFIHIATLKLCSPESGSLKRTMSAKYYVF